MHSNNFEEAFGNFLDTREYDRIEEAIFKFAREAFEAGWKAAGGGVMPDDANIVDILKKSLND